MLWFKVFHLLFVTAWMAGLFYLPRIFVHYVEGLAAGEDVRRLVVMGDKLYRFSSLMALLALGFGVVLWLVYGISGNWLYAKMGLVAVLLLYHHQCMRYLRQMKRREQLPSSLFFRLFNESALLVFIPILILVILKPF